MRGCFRLLGVASIVGASATGCATALTNDPGLGDDGGFGPGIDSGSHGDAGPPIIGDGGLRNDTGTPNPDSGNPPPVDSGNPPPTDSGNPPPVDSGNPPPVDSGATCTPVTIPSGNPPDAGTCPAPVTGVCGPADVSTFSPVFHPPTGAKQNLCTPSDIANLYTACLDPILSSMPACQAYQLSSAACFGCVVSNLVDPSWGPLVSLPNGLVNINIAGCVALVESCNLTCAEDYEANLNCEFTACVNNCPVTDQASSNAYNACNAKADGCGCKAYYPSAQCIGAITGASHPAAKCVTQTTFKGYYDAVVPIFCGN